MAAEIHGPPADDSLQPDESLSGIILAGGLSRRFGSPKAGAIIAGRTVLDHVADSLARVCAELIIVSRMGQPVHATPRARLVHDDSDAVEGPLRGIVAGLAATRTPLAAVAACDCPALQPALIHLLARRIPPEADVIVPVSEERLQPLHAVYRTATLPILRELLRLGEASPTRALRHLNMFPLKEADWRLADPRADSFRNINTPADLEALRRQMNVG